ncbi:cupin domain-containing protein [Methylobacterium sp. J-076]|uniref:cupin domain-containing protein n=1 Tax=Methylobacterium sp. J-076 TaxID=2836655 RepID=UPI001FB9AC03|nr:cupin domain-containing protein [Methylobacterium sp. J-076]MCJ2014369.1 cupin domain-containing protein [Methylobacterium sp. J-076]
MKKILAVASLSMAAVGAYAEIALHEDGRSLASTAVATKAALFQPSPIPAHWVVAGNPVAEAVEVSRTQDDGAQVFLWRTTAGTFRWTHMSDEIVTILRGEVFVTDADGTRHHLTVGDVAHFPAGAIQTWEVPKELLKSAILKHRSPASVEAPMRWLRQMRAMVSG